ncbi:S8 family Peptidase [Stemphylium lycopersici]|uniref:S8 family Peptidase n=1 Tax=Stemphylium lycopersici TaxID=183478 RepID=A0A364NDI5_STELY|nr:hypothetical protein TW65_07533 [Stemphylium lycopersici]RAR00972.1 S8 family Peptidase [Stemphylium lycopersici]RAR15267.1 S8 family Peptidase [Stemphylium lycopersici]
MAHCKDRAFPSEFLASVALVASELLLNIAIENKNAPASAIAVRLHSIGHNLSSQLLYELPADAQQLSERALHALLDICLWPMVSSSKAFSQRKESPEEVYRDLCDRFQKDQVKTQQSIIKFCKARPSKIKPFEDYFVDLSNKLSKNVDDLHGSANDSNAYSHIAPLARDVYPDEVHQLLLDGIRRYSSCVNEVHKDTSSNPSELHITRLCLSSGFRSSKDQLALFDVITASSQMSYWQEMTINIPITTLIESGKICEWLENPTYTKICLNLDQDHRLYERPGPEDPLNILLGCGIRLSQLVKEAEFTVEHKIKLSYTIARAFWQFYSSDLMKARWTSEDIWFIRLDKEVEQSDDIPLRAFVSFPFGSQFHEAPDEFYGENQYLHCYPRILYLGIVLLEIGLGQSLSIKRNSAHNLAAHINRACSKARIKLRELEKADWDGFQWKNYYVKAIGNCLESFNFKDTAMRQKIRAQGARSDNTTHLDSPVEERRKSLFRNVVTPLLWLATVGFENSEEVLRVPIQKKPQRQSSSAGSDELQQFWRERHSLSYFCSSGTANTQEYLADLQKIAGHVHRCRRLAKITKPIRVAILDTGCKKDLDFFQDPGSHLENLLTAWYQAIEHAGLDPEWNVDVISMSFGYFDKPGMSHTIIEDAIEKVKKGRKDKILFIASAGNSWLRRRDFPASHKDVIPIYAGDSNGVFLESNPAHTGKKLGTYGKEIPSSIVDEVKNHFPEADFSAGTSIATAIAAGIVAMMLSYAAALPTLMKNNGFEEVCAKLFTKKGMEHMLEAMSLTRDNEEYFISPIWYWGEKEKDMDVLVSICAAIEQMNKQPPE